MAREQKDVFGFDELGKAFEKVIEKYPDTADALLMAHGRQANKCVKQKTNRKTGYLRRSWRLRKVKLYKNGRVRVVRVASVAPHAHLYEYGHRIVLRTRTRDERGRYAKEESRLGKVSKLSKRQRIKSGVTDAGFVQGKNALEETMKEIRDKFGKDAQKMLDKLTEELEV